MQTLDQAVLEAALGWLAAADRRVWLCTIVAGTGSAPRPPGTLLACDSAGGQVGSLSGGCIEDDLLERLREGRLPDTAAVVEYGVSAEENERLGLPCGGRLQVLVQPLDPDRDGAWLRAALAAMAERRCLLREVSVGANHTDWRPAEHFAPLAWDGDVLRQTFGPRQRMLLVGAGQLSQTLAELALAMDYEVLVTDPREHVRAQWAGPEVPLLGGMPDDVIRAEASDAHSLVITLTHDPRIDDMALMEALTGAAWYVGALGSRRTTEKRLERLRQLGLSETQLSALHAPVGLDIGSKTPMEIAVAILAELVRLRRRPA
jgi:xanthine dehydrogenase accessory factor